MIYLTKHVVLFAPPIEHIFSKDIRKRTIVLWFVPRTRSNYADILLTLDQFHEVSWQNYNSSPVKFVATNFSQISSERLKHYTETFGEYGTGLLNSQGLTAKKFLHQYDARIESRIQNLIESDRNSKRINPVTSKYDRAYGH
ncbi:MAG TPA: hypothetical protein VHQ41_01725 [Patescibacteria group bacterium]|jgi:hypothetical protein|nr:hypothetical protein [Patescibacteria group bacterium]